MFQRVMLLTLVAFSSLIGCASGPSETVPSVKVRTIDFGYPNIDKPNEDEAMVVKAGIAMTATATMPERRSDTFYTDLDEVPAFIDLGDTKTFEVTSQEMEYFESPYLTFEVECSNTSDSDLTLAGALLTIEIDGKSASFDPSALVPFDQITVPAGENVKFSLPGPKWELLHDESTLVLQIKNVAIGVDRETFEFPFAVSLVPQQLTIEEKTVEKELSSKQRASMNQRIAKDQRRAERVLRPIQSQ